MTAAEKAERCALAQCPLAGKGDERCEKCTGPVSWTDKRGRRTGAGGCTHRSCTSCPMNGLGLPVCWAGCDGPVNDFQTDGQKMVTLGGMNDPDRFVGIYMNYAAKIARLPSGESRANLPPGTANALLRILRIVAGMTREQLLYFHARLQGMNCAEASKSLGRTKQNGHQTGRRVAKKFPEMRAFFDSDRSQRQQTA